MFVRVPVFISRPAHGLTGSRIMGCRSRKDLNAGDAALDILRQFPHGLDCGALQVAFADA